MTSRKETLSSNPRHFGGPLVLYTVGRGPAAIMAILNRASDVVFDDVQEQRLGN